MESWPVPPLIDLPPAPGRLRLFDTAVEDVVEVGPATGTARSFVCGITPYDATHLGHANTYLAFDLMHRQWLDCGLDVHYVQNVTDVDDPLLERAAATGIDWRSLAAEQTQLFRDDMAALNVIPPNQLVAVSEVVAPIADCVAQMAETGAAYQVPGEYADWYFDVTAGGGLNHVNHLDADRRRELFAEFGGDPDRTGKRNATDPLLWRLSRPGEPAWDSPIGTGRPGWHIECCVIATDELGTGFDVQGGGRDLVFPHHEMSAAHCVAATGEPFAKHYVHSGMVALAGAKMSKSLGNLELISRLRDQHDPMAIRLAIMSNHYREDWEWKPAALRVATDRLDRWRSAVRLEAAMPAEQVAAEVREALRDDLDTDAAIAAIDAWAGASLAIHGDDPGAIATVTAIANNLLGIELVGVAQ